MDNNKWKKKYLADDEKAHEKNLNTTDNPETGWISLFGVGGTGNENQQTDQTIIITSTSIESKTEEEQEHVIFFPAKKSVLNVLDDESSDDDDDDNDDDESIVVNHDAQDKDEYTVLFQNTKLRFDFI